MARTRSNSRAFCMDGAVGGRKRGLGPVLYAISGVGELQMLPFTILGF